MNVHPLIPALVAAVVAALLTNLLVPPVARLAVALRAFDEPGGRKKQSAPIPRLGGVALAGGLAVGAGGMTLVRWPELAAVVGRTEMVALALATGVVFLVGVIDDLMGVAVWKKFLAEVVAAGIVVGAGWTVTGVSLPWGGTLALGWLGPVVAVVWLVGVTNAMNLLDGLDGLAGGVAAIMATSLLVYAGWLGNAGTVILMGATTGACLGFLRHNWAPARIYLGDSGSLTLGFLLAAATLHSSIKAPAAVAILVPLLALGIPVIDTLLVMMLRFLSRPHSPFGERLLGMFLPDRSHLHHLLLHRHETHARTVTTIYAVVVASCVLALTVALTRNPTLGAAVLALELLVVLGMRRLGFQARLDRVTERALASLEALEETPPAAATAATEAADGDRPPGPRALPEAS